jgi:hypothetical protein
VHPLLRRLAGLVVALALLALVACDLWVGAIRSWWDRHSLTGSVVSNLLVLAVTALIVDEIVARRQRRERAVSVAVQGLIVYGQARRAADAIAAQADAAHADAAEDQGDGSADAAAEELRTLAAMLLTASPSLFDDSEARRFLDQVERFSVSMFRTVQASSGGPVSGEDRARLTTEMSDLRATVEPLLARIPAPDRSALEGSAT